MRGRWGQAVAWCCIAVAFCVVFPVPTAAEEPPPRIAVTIAPLHSIVAALMAGVGEPDLLIPAGQSPHTYQLRASTVRQIRAADWLVAVAPAFEPGIAKAAHAEGRAAQITFMAEIEGVSLLPARSLHHDDHEEEEADGALHDYHLWLDPENGLALARAFTGVLVRLDPANQAKYQENLLSFSTRLAELDARLAAELSPHASKPFLVFHDAFQYFEHHFGLVRPEIVTVAPERPASAKQVAALRAQIRAKGIVCLFSEPQFTPPLMNAISEGLPVRRGTLDPLGLAHRPGPDLYLGLLQDLGGAISTCQSGG